LNSRITGSDPKTAASSSLHAMPAGDSALHSTKRMTPADTNPSRRADGEDASRADDPVPVERVAQVPQRPLADVGDAGLVRQDHGPRRGDAEAPREHALEVLLVGLPPERAVTTTVPFRTSPFRCAR